MAKSEKQSVSYDHNNQEVIVRNKKQRIGGTFSAIGRLSTVHNQVGEDIFDKLEQVSKGAISLFVQLKRHRDDQNNLVPYPTKEWSQTHRESFSRQLKELRTIGLVRVAKRVMKSATPGICYTTAKQTYMIDPNAIKCWKYQDAERLWEQCKK
jgi:hypothetical protein